MAIRAVGVHTVLVSADVVDGFDQAVGAGGWHLWDDKVWVENFEVFTKQGLPKVVSCTNPDVYRHALTRGKRYLVVQERAGRASVRVRGDHGRLRWFPATCFDGAGQE